MKVLCVVHGYPPSIGGSQWLAKNLCEQLVSGYGDEVTVFTTVAYNMEHFWRSGEPAMPAGTTVINGVTVRRFEVFNRLNRLRMLLAAAAYRLRLPYNDWLRTIYNGPLIRGMTQAVADSGADVVVALAFPLMQMYYALWGARRARVPIVLVGALHTADVWHYDRKMIYGAIQRADAYVALTAFERDYLVGRDIPSDKITVVGGGVDAAPFVGADGQPARRRYGWGDAPLVATMGKQTPRKRFDALIRAMPRVWQRHPQARLLIAGARGPASASLRGLIDALPLAQRDRITLLSDFAEDEKPELLAACDLFVLPSGHESFGIAFVEAWACARPVIGVRVGAIPSVIDQGRDGLLVAHGEPEALSDAIVELLADPERRARMGRAGQRKVLENYTWEIVTDRIRAVFVKTIAQHAQQR